MRRCRHYVACAALAAFTCSACSSTPTATFTVTTGEETDAFSRAPAPTTLVVDVLDLAGNAQEVARAALPADTLALGDKGRTDVGAIRVTALDATGKALLRGETLYVQFGALEDSPLEVFVQRLGELARMPGGSAVLDGPKLAVTNARYVVAASGTDVLVYDLLLLRALPGIPAFPRPARSLVTFGTAAIVIDEQGATTVDLSTAQTADLAAPAGGTFAEVAGGSTVTAPDGSAYVVGGTRTSGGLSQRVLAISKDGAVAFATLAVPREGACATWVEGRGLVVVGGNAVGAGANATAAGAEVIAPGSRAGRSAPLPCRRREGLRSDGARCLARARRGRRRLVGRRRGLGAGPRARSRVRVDVHAGGLARARCRSCAPSRSRSRRTRRSWPVTTRPAHRTSSACRRRGRRRSRSRRRAGMRG